MSGPAAVLVGSIQSGSNPGDAAKYRMTIARYLNLAWVLALWNICSGLQERFEIVKKLTARFQSDFDLTEDGKIKPVPDSGDSNYDQLMRLSEQPVTDPVRRSLERLLVLNRDPLIRKQYGRIVTRSELAVFLQRSQRVNGKYEPEWFLPFYWALATAEEALEKGLIRDNRIFLKVQEEIYAWSGKIRVLINFARRGLPLVYTQVVIIAVYTVFLSDTLSRQLLDPKEAITRKAKGYYVDYLVPILGIVHMIFMVGWFKVALVLMDPFGVDEEDFPFSTIFNSNMRLSKEQCGTNISWYPKKLRPAFDAQRQKKDRSEGDSEGPVSDDELFKPMIEMSQAEAERKNQIYGTFTLEDGGDE
ncbi:hypothetical protein BOX15_Mlig016239g1 [Macrostomum lignano]|uniref:Bestrophin homolog n=1 Tax=Macrostomum lignano TaxID=282301 RepID=A0A267FB99_9PLAT|nr:hypothetical protein BOX15_Mlig016239g1 [Macrostomum lignano]